MKAIYKARSQTGEIVTGELSVTDKRDAVRRLNAQGLTPVQLELGEAKLQADTSEKKVKPMDTLMAMHQLSTLLDAGITLSDALTSLTESIPHSGLKLSFADILSRLQAGASFSEALKESELQLPSYIYPLAEAGELTGDIAKALRDGLDQMRYEHQIAAEMKNALLYPAILIFSGIAAVLLIFIVVVPKFSGLLKKSNGDLPLIAELTLSTGMFFNNNLLLVMIVIIATLSGFVFLIANENARQKIWDTALTLPVIGEWLTTSEIARWSAMFSTLLSSSIEITQALTLAQVGVKGTLLNAKLTQVVKSVKGGESLATSLQENGAITAMGYGLIKVGEVSGELPKMLHSLSKIYTDNSKERMARFLTLLEPIAIVSIGGMIGTIMTGIILAITSANDIAI